MLPSPNELPRWTSQLSPQSPAKSPLHSGAATAPASAGAAAAGVATTGCQPTPPYWKTESGAPAEAVVRKYQVAVAGSKEPMPDLPAPAQSPARGIQPSPPKAKTPASGAPA